MRLAALYDIHGNLPALDAVLDDVRQANVDHIVVGGDVFPGPMPLEVLARLQQLSQPVHFISGNGDRLVLTAKAGGDISEVPPPFRDLVTWCAEIVDDEHAAEMGAWPATRRLRVDGVGAVLFCHATPRNDTEIFTRHTPDDRLTSIFDRVADVVVCGHTHMQFDRIVGTTRVVNAGSVGMPFAAPGAYWLLLGPGVELRRTDYDLEAAATRIRATRYPKADEFAARSILDPPGEDEMLKAYSAIELR
jgi:putative phosphoesterase